MAGIKNYSTTAGSNNSASPNGAPEGMAPSGVNDTIRQIMADVRSDYEGREWRDWGHTVTYATATTFTIPTDVTSIYTVNRPIRCTDTTTLYGYVSASSYSAPNTTVTVTLDSGSLSASLTAVALGFDVTNKPIHSSGIRGGAIGTGTANTWTATQTLSGAAVNYAAEVSISSASTVNIGAAASNNVYITGTTTITAFDSVSAGITRKVRFEGALTLTHNGTSLILPGSANITTAANDCAEFESLGSGNWICTKYIKNDGTVVVGTLTSGAITTASGTSIDFPGIPSWVKRITVQLSGVSTNGTSPILVQLGDSGGIETSGYVGAVTHFATSTLETGNVTASGFQCLYVGVAAANYYGFVVLTLTDSGTNLWTATSTIGRSDSTDTHIMGAGKSTSATLDRVRITTTNGTDAFDNGKINILYE